MNTPRLRLYDANSIESLPWPHHEDGIYARKYLYPMIVNGPHHYIDNVKTTMLVLTIDDLVLPLTVNDTEAQNAYVCSIHTYYIKLTDEILDKLKYNFVKKPLKWIVNAFGSFLNRGSIDKVVVVNNWLIPTNLYPHITEEQIVTISNFLSSQYPDHALIFPSITKEVHPPLYHILKKHDFDMVTKRRIFFLDTKKEGGFRTRMFKSDFKLLQKQTFQVLDHAEIPKEKVSRIADLYHSLYLKKHSRYSSKFNHNFIKLILEENLLNVKALQHNGEIEGVMGYFHRHHVMTSPLFGYNTERPQTDGLYRLLSVLQMLDAQKQQVTLNFSAGASSFKKLRGGKPCIEYIAVFHRHLPFRRRIRWKVLQKLLNGIGAPVMNRFDL